MTFLQEGFRLYKRIEKHAVYCPECREMLEWEDMSIDNEGNLVHICGEIMIYYQTEK